MGTIITINSASFPKALHKFSIVFMFLCQKLLTYKVYNNLGSNYIGLTLKLKYCVTLVWRLEDLMAIESLILRSELHRIDNYNGPTK